MSKEITIQGVAVLVAQPYSEGHTCTEAEAKALNQVRAENIRNNTAKLVKDAKGEGDDVPESAMAELIAAIQAYDAGYEFTLASVGGGRKTSDPVEIEATRMARAAISAKLKADGRTVKSVDADVLANAIAKLAGSERIMKAAAKAVKERSSAADEALEGMTF
tara:strand:+ start:2697 stop:3185 length:489 start_codon:yes stop_codon:yes gene_type:complete